MTEQITAKEEEELVEEDKKDLRGKKGGSKEARASSLMITSRNLLKKVALIYILLTWLEGPCC